MNFSGTHLEHYFWRRQRRRNITSNFPDFCQISSKFYNFSRFSRKWRPWKIFLESNFSLSYSLQKKIKTPLKNNGNLILKNKIILKNSIDFFFLFIHTEQYLKRTKRRKKCRIRRYNTPFYGNDQNENRNCFCEIIRISILLFEFKVTKPTLVKKNSKIRNITQPPPNQSLCRDTNSKIKISGVGSASEEWYFGTKK